MSNRPRRRRSLSARDLQGQWSEEIAGRLVEEWRRSGSTLAAFCRARGFSAQRFTYWRDRLDAWSGESCAVVQATAARPRARVISSHGRVAEAATVELAPAQVIASQDRDVPGNALVHLGCGVTIELRDATAAWVAAVAYEIVSRT